MRVLGFLVLALGLCWGQNCNQDEFAVKYDGTQRFSVHRDLSCECVSTFVGNGSSLTGLAGNAAFAGVAAAISNGAAASLTAMASVQSGTASQDALNANQVPSLLALSATFSTLRQNITDLYAARAGMSPAEATEYSCQAILAGNPRALSGYYWIRSSNGPVRVYCDMVNDGGGWMLITPSMIRNSTLFGITPVNSEDSLGGFITVNNINNGGCGNGPSSNGFFYIVDLSPQYRWSKIRYDALFYGANSCWSVFGHQGYCTVPCDIGLVPFSTAGGDTIRNQVNMGGQGVQTFDGTLSRCDNTNENFWHGVNAAYNPHSASLIQRRSSRAGESGLGVGVSCSAVSNNYWRFSNVYVR